MSAIDLYLVQELEQQGEVQRRLLKPKNIPAPPTAATKMTNVNLKNVFFRISYSPLIYMIAV